jgi:hypothetical protein
MQKATVILAIGLALAAVGSVEAAGPAGKVVARSTTLFGAAERGDPRAQTTIGFMYETDAACRKTICWRPRGNSAPPRAIRARSTCSGCCMTRAGGGGGLRHCAHLAQPRRCRGGTTRARALPAHAQRDRRQDDGRADHRSPVARAPLASGAGVLGRGFVVTTAHAGAK